MIMKKEPEQPSYAVAHAELQQIVSDIQEETINLDELTERIARATELIRFCRERLASPKVPRSFEFRDSLPYSPLGKVMRTQL